MMRQLLLIASVLLLGTIILSGCTQEATVPDAQVPQLITITTQDQADTTIADIGTDISGVTESLASLDTNLTQ